MYGGNGVYSMGGTCLQIFIRAANDSPRHLKVKIKMLMLVLALKFH